MIRAQFGFCSLQTDLRIALKQTLKSMCPIHLSEHYEFARPVYCKQCLKNKDYKGTAQVRLRRVFQVATHDFEIMLNETDHRGYYA